MNEPLISVIVPVYQAEQYLRRCVNSICGQTYSNIEILLIDDGSIDRSGAICDELALSDPRIKVIHQPNSGQAAARNRGLDMAQGEWIGFVDADDYIALEMYQKLHDLCCQFNAKIACCGIERVSDNGHLSFFNDQISDFLVLDRVQALRELVDNYRVTSSPCDKLFCRNIFENKRMAEGMIYEDYEIMHQCIYDADKVVYTGEPMYFYYQSPDSTIRKKYNPKRFDEVTAERRRLEFFREKCPDNLDVESARFVRTGVTVLVQSRGAKSCRKLRKELRRELLQFVQVNPALDLHPSIAQKMGVLKYGLAAFDAALVAAEWKRNLLG